MGRIILRTGNMNYHTGSRGAEVKFRSGLLSKHFFAGINVSGLGNFLLSRIQMLKMEDDGEMKRGRKSLIYLKNCLIFDLKGETLFRGFVKSNL